MNESKFWSLIDLLYFNAESDELIIRPLVLELSMKSIETIKEFNKYLNKKMVLLNGNRYWNVYKKEVDSNIDNFLSFRCGVIAEGEIAFNEFVKTANIQDFLNNEISSYDLMFDYLMEIPYLAVEQKTGNCNISFYDERVQTDYLKRYY